MLISSNDFVRLRVKQIEPHTFTETDRAVIVLGTGATRQVLLFIGPSDAEGFVAFCKNELISMSESEFAGYIAGLFKVWREGSSLLQTRNVTAETGGTVCGFELGEQLCLEIVGQGAQWITDPVSAIYFHSSK